MSENKCPCCGGEVHPETIERDGSVMSAHFECEDCAFSCELNDIPSISAAMELARATNEYDNSNLRKIMRAGARLNAAYERVLEVFNAK